MVPRRRASFPRRPPWALRAGRSRGARTRAAVRRDCGPNSVDPDPGPLGPLVDSRPSATPHTLVRRTYGAGDYSESRVFRKSISVPACLVGLVLVGRPQPRLSRTYPPCPDGADSRACAARPRRATSCATWDAFRPRDNARGCPPSVPRPERRNREASLPPPWRQKPIRARRGRLRSSSFVVEKVEVLRPSTRFGRATGFSRTTRPLP